MRCAAVAAVVTAAGLTPSSRPAARAEITTHAALAYNCQFPSGPQQVGVRVAGTFPAVGVVGKPIQPTDVTVTVTVPQSALTDLTGLKAATVATTAQLTTTVTHSGTSTEATWSGLETPPTPIPDSGDLVLGVSEVVPTVTAGEAGDLTFTAAALSVTLTPRKADGTPTDPATLRLACTLAPGEDAHLATVPVAALGSNESLSPSGSKQPKTTRLTIGADPHASFEAPPCTSARIPSTLLAYVTGFSNVSKLNGASELPPGCAKVAQGAQRNRPKSDGIHFYQHSTAQLDFHGLPELPPASATFLAFKFVPTTATMELTQVAPLTIDSDLNLTKAHGTTKIRAALSLRISDVRVNGVPLDVGPNCRTVEPVSTPDPELTDPNRDPDLDPDKELDGKPHIVLTGTVSRVNGVFRGYQLVTGGPLDGTFTIPPFTGCGVGEDLDPIFTASVSGPGDYVKQIQGAPCAPITLNGCKPDVSPIDVPKPQP